MPSAPTAARFPILRHPTFARLQHYAQKGGQGMQQAAFYLRTAALTGLLVLSTSPATQAAPGDVDSPTANIGGHWLIATAVQPDGKTIIAGKFTSVLGQPRNNIARLNADGTLDTGFDPNANSDVFCVTVQADGQILLGGNFTSLGGITRSRIARVMADGTLDAGFNPNVSGGDVSSLVVQADGQILLAGGFTTVGGVTRNRIARVAADGTLDSSFNPDANDAIMSVAELADGQILLGGGLHQRGGKHAQPHCAGGGQRHARRGLQSQC